MLSLVFPTQLDHFDWLSDAFYLSDRAFQRAYTNLHQQNTAQFFVCRRFFSCIQSLLLNIWRMVADQIFENNLSISYIVGLSHWTLHCYFLHDLLISPPFFDISPLLNTYQLLFFH